MAPLVSNPLFPIPKLKRGASQETRRALVAEVGRKRRPVLLLTRSEVLDARDLVTVAEITTSIRGLAAEFDLDHVGVDLDRPSVIDCDGLHTITQASLSGPVGRVGDDVMRKVCSAVS